MLYQLSYASLMRAAMKPRTPPGNQIRSPSNAQTHERSARCTAQKTRLAYRSERSKPLFFRTGGGRGAKIGLDMGESSGGTFGGNQPLLKVAYAIR
jgi:hypothetical protein